MQIETILMFVNSDNSTIILLFFILSYIIYAGSKIFRSDPLVNLNVINDELVIKKIYTIKCHRCKEFIYSADICYDNITKYPYHKRCLDVYDHNVEKQYQPT